MERNSGKIDPVLAASLRKNAELSSLRELEKDYLGFLLGITRHNVTDVSRIPAISRTAVYHKISRYSLSKPSQLTVSFSWDNL